MSRSRSALLPTPVPLLPMDNLQPTFSEFRRLARQGNVVPVFKAVVADTLTPVSAYLRLAKGRPYSFMLESVEGGETLGRYTFLGVDPFMIVRCRGNRITIERGRGEIEETGNLFEIFRDLARPYRPVSVPGIPPFAAGAVGYLSYETVRQLEKLPANAREDLTLDDALLMYFTDLLAVDHARRRIMIIANVLTEEGSGSLRQKYHAAVRRIEQMERRLKRPAQAERPRRGRRTGRLSVRSNLTRRQFMQNVEKAKEYIRAGDIFQVVLSQRMKLPLRVPPFDVYRTLRIVNPSPYLYYLQMRDVQVVGSSPEMLVKVTGRQVDYRPIAGTRPRGQTEEEDRRLAEELRADEKECAEHIMLVDLGRNDVGRVSEFGSVALRELMRVERYSHVMHLVSWIQGRLRADTDSYAALAACFPAGTLSGAPKIRAMEIIDELEPTRRSLYGGAVLYADFSGNLNSCIVIRTLLIKGREAYLQAGAGIVADSVPEREYEESINKAKAVLKAVELAEKGL